MRGDNSARINCLHLATTNLSFVTSLLKEEHLGVCPFLVRFGDRKGTGCRVGGSRGTACMGG